MKTISLIISDEPDDTPRHRLGIAADIDTLKEFEAKAPLLLRAMSRSLRCYHDRAFKIEMRDWCTAKKSLDEMDREAGEYAPWSPPSVPTCKTWLEPKSVPEEESDEQGD